MSRLGAAHALVVAGWFSLAAPLRADEPPSRPLRADEPSSTECECASGEGERAGPRESEPRYIVIASVLPRVDGWDEEFGHRSGWGASGGLELSPWPSFLELMVEVTHLRNREDRLTSFDVGLKIPFHRGHRVDFHAMVGPTLAYERFTTPHGEREGEVVVGFTAGVGAALWLHRHVGLTFDVSYRVLGGAGISHRLFESLGVAARW